MSKSRHPITLPELGFLSFDPTAQAADKKKAAPGEAGRPKDCSMMRIGLIPSLDKAIAAVDPDKIPSAVVRTQALKTERHRMKQWLAERVRGGRSVEIVTLTPVLAELLLESNTHNRPKAKTHINTLVRENSGGRFQFNGESLSVTESGVLGDGQHRCEMIVATGIPAEVVIVFGIKDEAVKTINLGLSRSAANVLAMDGMADSNAVSTVANLIWQWKTHGRLANASNQRPTKTQVVDAAEHYEGISESIEFCKRKRTKLVASRTVLAFCHWAFTERAGREMADLFIARLVDGDRPVEGEPISYCRDRLLGIKGWVFPQLRASLIFQCWNAWRRKAEVQRLNVNTKTLPKLER